MKQFLQSFFLVAIGLFFASSSFGQLSSTHAIGGRFGSASGITYRYSLSSERAVEGIMSIQSNSTSSRFRLVGLYEHHKALKNDFVCIDCGGESTPSGNIK